MSPFFSCIGRQGETKASENALPLPRQDVFVALKPYMCLLSVCMFVVGLDK